MLNIYTHRVLVSASLFEPQTLTTSEKWRRGGALTVTRASACMHAAETEVCYHTLSAAIVSRATSICVLDL